MGDNTKLALLLATELKVRIPELKMPSNAPIWFQNFYPVLMDSINSGVDATVEKIATGFNDCVTELEQQVTDLKQELGKSNKELASLKDSIQDKQLKSEEQNVRINSIEESVDKNESYSRRNNLIFGNIVVDKDKNQSCEAIIRDICENHLAISTEKAKSMNFIRCHFLNRKQNKTCSIIASFESFADRTLVWERRRKLSATQMYISEDFPLAISKRRNKLRPILKKASQSNDYQRKISMKGDKIIFNGVPHGVEDLATLPEYINPRTLSERKTENTLVFGGILSEYHELSNFFKCNIKHRGKTFNCVEQSFQWSKAMLLGTTEQQALFSVPQTQHDRNISARMFLDLIRKNGWLQKIS